LEGEHRILLPVNRAHGYEDVLELARSLVRGGRGRIHAIYVIEMQLKYPLDAEVGEEILKGEEALAEIEHLSLSGRLSLQGELVQARQAGPAIVQEAANIPATMIIMGVDFGNDAAGFRMSTTADYVLRNARCPVILWRSGAPLTPFAGG
jgi:nucleotide-binding universal stress UspA family protein